MADYLIHFNPYHNPKNGQFASSKSGQVYGKLDRMSNEKLYKTLKKEVRETKKEKWGWANQWMSQLPIGPNSEKLIYEKEQKEKAYKNTPEYKAWNKKVKTLSTKGENGTVDPDKFDDMWEKLMGEQPARNFDTLSWVKMGNKYLNDFVNKGGKELTIAMLEDMGYNSNKAKEYANKIAKSGLTLGE